MLLSLFQFETPSLVSMLFMTTISVLPLSASSLHSFPEGNSAQRRARYCVSTHLSNLAHCVWKQQSPSGMHFCCSPHQYLPSSQVHAFPSQISPNAQAFCSSVFTSGLMSSHFPSLHVCPGKQSRLAQESDCS